MKKFLAMILVCMMLATPVLAESDESVDKYAGFSDKVIFGEEEDPDPAAKATYFGKWVSVKGEDNGCIDIYLPRFWEEYDVTVENETAAFAFDANACYASAGGEGTWGMYVLWTALEEATDAASLQAEYVNTYADAEVVTLNGVDFVRYTDTERDAVMLVWPRATGMYSIAFGPASDVDITDYVKEMITTVVAYEGAAE